MLGIVGEILEQHFGRVRFETLRVRLGLLAAQRIARARERELAAIEQPGDQHRCERDRQERDQKRNAALAFAAPASWRPRPFLARRRGGVSVPLGGTPAASR